LLLALSNTVQVTVLVPRGSTVIELVALQLVFLMPDASDGERTKPAVLEGAPPIVKRFVVCGQPGVGGVLSKIVIMKVHVDYK
jgi:hypothetical protein